MTLLLVFTVLMYVFASLPETVYYLEDAFTDHNTFFYVALGVIALFNFPLYALSAKFNKDQPLAIGIYSWIFTLAIILNGFLFTALQYINMYNSGEKVSYDYYAYYLYICLGLLIASLVALPIIFFKYHKK